MKATHMMLQQIQQLANTAIYWHDEIGHAEFVFDPGLQRNKWKERARRNRDQCIAEIQALADELKEGVE